MAPRRRRSSPTRSSTSRPRPLPGPRSELGLSPASASARAVGVVATSADAPVAVSVANPTAPGGFLTAGRRERTIAFRRPDSAKGGTSADPTIHDGIADYTDFLPGVDLRVVPDAWGVKSFFVWKTVPAVPSISYVVDPGDLRLVARADGSIGLVDPSGTTVARIPRPYAVDSTPDAFAGGGRFTDAVSLTLGADGRTVTVSVDPAWLKTAVYPVYVDPTVSWDNAGSLSYGDAHIASDYPKTNFGNYVRPDSPYYHELWLGDDPSGTSGTSYDFLRWNLSSIVGTTIDAATIDIFPYHQYYNAPTSTQTWLALVTASWLETDPTWNNRPNSSAANQVSHQCVEGQTCTFDVRAYTQGWANGTANYGIKLWENGNGSTYWKRLIAAEEGGSHVEHMSVTYHSPVATGTTPAFSGTATWTYSDPDAQTKFHVDVATSSGFGASIVATSGDVTSGAKEWRYRKHRTRR